MCGIEKKKSEVDFSLFLYRAKNLQECTDENEGHQVTC